MQKTSVASAVEEFITPIVEDLGYYIVEVEYTKKQNGMNLTIFIDNSDGIKIEDCEKVHMAIDEPLDELDPTNGASYTLNVSSPGLDRPLITNKDFEHNIGNCLEVSLYSKVNGEKLIVGTLISFSNEMLVLNSNDVDVELNRKNIAKVTKYIEF